LDSIAARRLKKELEKLEENLKEEPSESSSSLEGPWECHACTYINTDTTSLNCEMCGTVWWALKEEGNM